MRTRCLAVAILLASPVPAAAEWHIKPFVGLTFGGGTTFVDSEKPWQAESGLRRDGPTCWVTSLGCEADVGRAPRIFRVGQPEHCSAWVAG